MSAPQKIEVGDTVVLDWPGHGQHGREHEVIQLSRIPLAADGSFVKYMAVLRDPTRAGWLDLSWPITALRVVKKSAPAAHRQPTEATMPETTEDTPSVQHNAKARRGIIKKAMKQITDLEAQRKEIGESIRAVKQKLIKGDLGMKIGDFNAALRLYQLEGDDRDQFFDTLKETFEALGAGGQLDFVDALRSTENADDEEDRTERTH